jgi:hypothetical protein
LVQRQKEALERHAMSETPVAPKIEGTMYLFEKPELLTTQDHGDLGLDAPARPFAFAEKVRVIPLTISEMGEAAKHFPIILMSEELPIPMAVLGLFDDFNLFVDENGEWEHMTYVPGYFRRYPFALASEPTGERLAVVIDRAHPGLTPAGKNRLFENGKPTRLTQNAMEFSRTYEQDRVMTEGLMKKIGESGIIRSLTAQYNGPNGETIPFAQYLGVDEEILRNLADDKYAELRKANLIGIIYAHLLSLSNWRPLIARRMKRFGMTDREAVTPRAVSTQIN